MIVTNEKYKLELFKRKENSAYEWNDAPLITFKGRPANQVEVRKYRIQSGVQGNSDSTYIFCSNLPDQVKPGDKIRFLGKEWSVESTGYYFDEARFVNPGIFSDEYIANKCPKGISVK